LLRCYHVTLLSIKHGNNATWQL